MLDVNLNLIKELNPKLQFGKKGSKAKGGSINHSGTISAGDGGQGDGGPALIQAGDGYNGASGGDINLGPGIYTGGNGGENGNGGSLTIKAGDAK